MRAEALAADEGLRLLDVWVVDEPLPAGTGLDEVLDRLAAARKPLVVSALLGLRRLAGRRLHLDREDTAFRPVHADPGERAYRIENDLVTALAQLAIVDGRLRLAVYARPHGVAGRAYLLAIEPARRWMLYPSLVRWAGRELSRSSTSS